MTLNLLFNEILFDVVTVSVVVENEGKYCVMSRTESLANRLNGSKKEVEEGKKEVEEGK